MRVLLTLLFVAATPDGGTPGWKTNPSLNDAAAEALCRAELPKCRAPWAVFDAAPQPCANRGTLCQTLPTVRGVWRCGCDQCATDADCPEGRAAQVPASRCRSRVAAGMCTAAGLGAVNRGAPSPQPEGEGNWRVPVIRAARD